MSLFEPIAVVGIGCRFPGGVDSPAAFWSLLAAGRDAVTPLPADRHALLANAGPPFGGFLEDVWGFDPAFFGLSPREAEAIDPQHRLLLQTTWEALEDAGIPPSALAARGTTGVFLGLFGSDYASWSPPDDMLRWLGGSRHAAAGRIAYALDVTGPAAVLDTDRSSGLVAVHEACAKLRLGECDTAIVGAANLLLAPSTGRAFAAAGLLAPDGRCKFADAQADGFVRSEGVASLVLQPLARALADGARIYAVLRGSAVAASGRAGGDLMAQSADAQARLVTLAFERAGIEPRAATYVEAHGTGTPLGDRAELMALARVMKAHACWIGSVKTNIGHTEPCAGLAGLVKVALAASRRELPRSLHFRRFPDDLAAGEPHALRVVEAHVRLPDDAPFVAGVSAFGVSGINAHVVLEGPPRAARSVPAASATPLLCMSARTEEGLHTMARRHAANLREGGADLAAICHTAGAQRDHYEHRAAVAARSPTEAIAALEALPRATRARWNAGDRIVFVFPGQGGQWRGMGQGLLRESECCPEFAEKMAECDVALRRIGGFSLLEELASAARFDTIDVVQPLLVAMEISLAAMWRAWGIEPDAVVGTSMGEAAAAHVAGALTLDEALTVIVRRTRLMREVAGGAMAGVDLPAASVLPELDARSVSIAAVNSPTSTVISGERAAVEALVRAFEARGVFARLVRVDVASHSPRMDAILPALRNELRGLSPRATQIPMFSTVRGSLVAGEELGASYWADNLRNSVELAGAVRCLADEGATVFVEIGPHPVLRAPILDVLAEDARERIVVPTLARDEDELITARAALGKLYSFGVPLAWERVNPKTHFTPIPTYAWNNAPYIAARDDVPAFGPPLTPPTASRPPAQPATFPTRLAGAPEPARARLLAEQLKREVARILKLPFAEVNPERPLREHGLSSAAATELRATVGEWMGRAFPSSLLFDHPTIRALAAHLARDPAAAAVRAPAASVTTPGARAPVAIVGMAFRFPGGATSDEAFWRLLAEGKSAITEVPEDRWNPAALYDPNVVTRGRMHSKWGGFLTDVARFDAEFFGISPKEAESMDPQQRLLLELAWEALEQGGLARSDVAGTNAGVFVGIMNNNEYARRKALDTRPENVTSHTSTGDATSIAAGRLAYFFGTHGPAMAVDTACSSSLVALHLAIQSLRAGECDTVFVAGVNVIAHPTTTLTFAKTRLLSPTGSCKTFDVGADGYVRGEGACVLVLERLADARARRAPIRAVIRGTAVNQDGRGSGLTAPNGRAQQQAIARALADAGACPEQVSYVEAHGTGTALGDPIEVHALTRVFGEGRTEPLLLGAVKANLGHLEACAGLAGVVKVVLAFAHGEVPPQIHLRTLSPKLEAPAWLEIPRRARPWSGRLAGVSSFGFSGTNAHAVLEAPPPHEGAPYAPRTPALVCLSAHDEAALQRRAQALAASPLLRLPDAELSNLAASAARAEHLPVRAAVVCRTMEELRAGLRDLTASPALAAPPVVAFVYPDPAAAPLDAAAAATLYTEEPTFRDAFEACARALEARLETPLAQLFRKPLRDSHVDPRRARAITFAAQVALTAMWRAWGVHPESVLGEGGGEPAAAHAAGLLDLAAAAALAVGDEAPLLAPGAAPAARFVSSAAGAALGSDAVLDRAHWRRVAQAAPTRRADGTRALAAAGATLLVTMGPAVDGIDALTSLAAADPVAHVTHTLGALYVRGVDVDVRHFYAGRAGHFHPLPPYPFAGRAYWTPDLSQPSPITNEVRR